MEVGRQALSAGRAGSVRFHRHRPGVAHEAASSCARRASAVLVRCAVRSVKAGAGRQGY